MVEWHSVDYIIDKSESLQVLNSDIVDVPAATGVGQVDVPAATGVRLAAHTGAGLAESCSDQLGDPVATGSRVWGWLGHICNKQNVRAVMRARTLGPIDAIHDC